MPKQKRNQRRPRGPRKPRQRAANATMLPSKPAIISRTISTQRPPRNLVEALCGVTDPFCDAARGARWPDGNAFATVPFSNRAHIVIPTYANGGGLAYFTPVNAPWNVNIAASFAAGNYTMAAAQTSSTGALSLPNNFSGYRVVSAGIVMRNLTSVMNTSGYLIVTRMATYPALSATEASGTEVNPQVSVHPIAPGMEVPMVMRPLGTLSRDFTPFTAAGNTNITDPAWDVIKIEIVGAPVSAASSIDVEVFYNFEMQLPEASVLAAVMPKNSASAPSIMTMSDRITNAVVATGHRTVDSLAKRVESAAVSALGSLMSKGKSLAIGAAEGALGLAETALLLP